MPKPLNEVIDNLQKRMKGSSKVTNLPTITPGKEEQEEDCLERLRIYRQPSRSLIL
jgi:hypothetical protein